ncbi:GntR family transcriptional regulator [Consotaella salsifontis]|uniref:Transcriptional regulator, GntR family n=1 Tax=Consotaella salsifontis TaxID=1365950 RepID=A0A1T4QQJ1_9HYPH|nr:GntR family transcriptional regulator [Consotaella salsifontis]SKA06042.1 transcriptional regulator, GntR family [Consotaella salsifontis]
MTEALRQFLSGGAAARGGGPLYLRLRRSIESAVEAGVLGPGDALPSERDLADLADVSRVTVRKAVRDLVAHGLLKRRQGSGTFVALPVERVEQSLSVLTSFTEDMARRGLAVRSEFFDRGLYEPTSEETMTLGLSAGEKVARIGRLRMANGNPLAIERASLSGRMLPHPEELDGSLYEALDKVGARPVRAIQRISAALLDDSDAARLGVSSGAPSLVIERISYLASGKVVEFTRSRYRADAYDFVAELRLAESHL